MVFSAFGLLGSGDNEWTIHAIVFCNRTFLKNGVCHIFRAEFSYRDVILILFL